MVGALPDDEQERARRYVRREDRERFVVARMLIRRLCGAYFRLEPRAVPLRQSSLGKPYVVQEGRTGQHGLEFNVSHSGNCVILVWTEGGPVGVDVEAVERALPRFVYRDCKVDIFLRRVCRLRLRKA